MMTVGMPKEVPDCGRFFEIPGFNPDLTRSFEQLCRDAHVYVEKHKEELIKAWLARTGVDPRDAVMVVYQNGITSRIMMESRNEKDWDVIDSWRQGEGEMP